MGRRQEERQVAEFEDDVRAQDVDRGDGQQEPRRAEQDQAAARPPVLDDAPSGDGGDGRQREQGSAGPAEEESIGQLSRERAGGPSEPPIGLGPRRPRRGERHDLPSEDIHFCPRRRGAQREHRRERAGAPAQPPPSVAAPPLDPKGGSAAGDAQGGKPKHADRGGVDMKIEELEDDERGPVRRPAALREVLPARVRQRPERAARVEQERSVIPGFLGVADRIRPEGHQGRGDDRRVFVEKHAPELVNDGDAGDTVEGERQAEPELTAAARQVQPRARQGEDVGPVARNAGGLGHAPCEGLVEP